jgi:hypothetical protein
VSTRVALDHVAREYGARAGVIACRGVQDRVRCIAAKVHWGLDAVEAESRRPELQILARAVGGVVPAGRQQSQGDPRRTREGNGGRQSRG